MLLMLPIPALLLSLAHMNVRSLLGARASMRLQSSQTQMLGKKLLRLPPLQQPPTHLPRPACRAAWRCAARVGGWCDDPLTANVSCCFSVWLGSCCRQTQQQHQQYCTLHVY
jgi:hypothetical protein